MADPADDEEPSQERLIEELGARLQHLKKLHREAENSWDRPMTVIGAASVVGGSVWTVITALDPVGLVIAILGAVALAYDQGYRARRDERNALERRRQVDLVISSLAKLLEIQRSSPSSDE